MSIVKELLSGDAIPKSHLPFSPAIRSGGFLFISGQASVDGGGKIVPGNFEEECRRSFDNLKKIVEAAGLTMDHIVQVRNYVANQDDLVKFNEIYRAYFSPPFPARTTLIGCLGTVLKFEVDAIARY
ncbi:RidA family protein [Niabella drilacis]|uniref:2-iminobutanoate/2-iminopropanoate deaminase n=1 Tax=Niabella drilacis (strain DSM 25811 / CCM 8410 / CCUG 62505 / LMG 26954 / E90) TaxID=1285928 RepID=A0A1G6S3P8_NIADE|nr:RidA family protein [Niabella drilacis]SDD11542.1 2-iminobutanoate/2-iminopropanoate deaminase [Niabella drilacis]